MVRMAIAGCDAAGHGPDPGRVFALSVLPDLLGGHSVSRRNDEGMVTRTPVQRGLSFHRRQARHSAKAIGHRQGHSSDPLPRGSPLWPFCLGQARAYIGVKCRNELWTCWVTGMVKSILPCGRIMGEISSAATGNKIIPRRWRNVSNQSAPGSIPSLASRGCMSALPLAQSWYQIPRFTFLRDCCTSELENKGLVF
jgi:hypothetical protein